MSTEFKKAIPKNTKIEYGKYLTSANDLADVFITSLCCAVGSVKIGDGYIHVKWDRNTGVAKTYTIKKKVYPANPTLNLVWSLTKVE